MSVPSFYSPLIYSSNFAQTQSKSESDFDGWNVFLENQLLIGKVDGYLYDPETKKISYVCIELGEDFSSSQAGRHILYPREEVLAHPQKQELLLETLTEEFLALYPRYEIGQMLDQPMRKRIRQFFTSGYTDVTHHTRTTMRHPPLSGDRQL